jgi:hypothetical protein
MLGPDRPRRMSPFPNSCTGSTSRSQDTAVARFDPLTDNLVTRLELPGLHLTIVRLINDPVDVFPKLLRTNWAPNFYSFIKEPDEDLRRVAQGMSPLSGLYLNPGPPTWITSPVMSSTTTDCPVVG